MNETIATAMHDLADVMSSDPYRDLHKDASKKLIKIPPRSIRSRTDSYDEFAVPTQPHKELMLTEQITGQ